MPEGMVEQFQEEQDAEQIHDKNEKEKSQNNIKALERGQVFGKTTYLENDLRIV